MNTVPHFFVSEKKTGRLFAGIAAAAEALGVSRMRISYMLKIGRMKKVPLMDVGIARLGEMGWDSFVKDERTGTVYPSVRDACADLGVSRQWIHISDRFAVGLSWSDLLAMEGGESFASAEADLRGAIAERPVA